MDRDFVVSQFTRYVHGFDQGEEGVRLKYAHSLRVSSLCEQIAGSLGLSQAEMDLAWLIGVLHDIGRFEQLREYHTFVDYRSMDHVKYGAHYLFDDGHIRDFLDDGRLDDVIRMAIDQHNVYQLRENLTPRQRLFCQLIRDADKIDIFRVYVLYMSQKKNIWNVDWADFENQPISDSVMAQARQRKIVRTQDKKTFMDFYVGALCLYFDLVYPWSRQLAREQGYFDKILDFPSRNVDSEKKLDEIRCLVRKAETLPQPIFVDTMYKDM